MKINKILYRISIVLLIFGLLACSKEEITSKELLAYIKTDGPAVHETTINFKRTPATTIGPATTQFKAHLTREAQKDVVFTINADASLLEQFNKQNKTSFELLPATNYELSGINGLTVKAGEITSKDSVSITLKNRQDLTSTKGYLLPLSIQTISGSEKGVAISTTHRTVYIIVSSTFTNIDQSSDKPVSGSFIERNSPTWTILSSSEAIFAGYSADNVLDGDYETDYLANYAENNFISIDMQQVNSVKGLVFSPSYSFFQPIASKTIDVLTSLDNITWTEQGKYISPALDPSSSPMNPDNRNINFYSPVNARYIKVIFDKDLAADYNGYAEINAIK